MSLFSENKEFKLRGLVLKLVNTNCPELQSQFEDARSNKRVNMTFPVMVIPLQEGKIQTAKAFTTVTKNVSNQGVAIVVEGPVAFQRAILGFEVIGDMTFVNAEAKHTNPMGGGFFQVGFQMIEIAAPGDYPGLGSLKF